MEYPIKSVTLGGFDKADVIRYIEQSARTASEERQELAEDNKALRKKNQALQREVEVLREENTRLAEHSAELEGQLSELVSQLSNLSSRREALPGLLTAGDGEGDAGDLQAMDLQALLAENERLRQETERLSRDASAYAQFRERLGTIECEARERADTLETAANERVRQTLTEFYARYQELIQAVETTASHVTGELRKVEFNLSQLPRAMDQAGRELNALADQVNREFPSAQPSPVQGGAVPQGAETVQPMQSPENAPPQTAQGVPTQPAASAGKIPGFGGFPGFRR